MFFLKLAFCIYSVIVKLLLDMYISALKHWLLTEARLQETLVFHVGFNQVKNTQRFMDLTEIAFPFISSHYHLGSPSGIRF